MWSKGSKNSSYHNKVLHIQSRAYHEVSRDFKEVRSDLEEAAQHSKKLFFQSSCTLFLYQQARSSYFLHPLQSVMNEQQGFQANT